MGNGTTATIVNNALLNNAGGMGRAIYWLSPASSPMGPTVISNTIYDSQVSTAK